jgi:hypothetical protein
VDNNHLQDLNHQVVHLNGSQIKMLRQQRHFNHLVSNHQLQIKLIHHQLRPQYHFNLLDLSLQVLHQVLFQLILAFNRPDLNHQELICPISNQEASEIGKIRLPQWELNVKKNKNKLVLRNKNSNNKRKES